MAASRILLQFQNDPNKEWPTKDIVKLARRPKKEVNAELYRLQRQKLIEKVNEKPPVWKLTTGAGGMTGFGESEQNDDSMHMGKMKRGVTSAGDPDLQQKIIDVLRRHDYPLKPGNIAKSVGLKTAMQVNQTLYLMKNRGFISKVKDKPPEWALVPHVLSSSGSSSEELERDVRPTMCCDDANFPIEPIGGADAGDDGDAERQVYSNHGNVDLDFAVSMAGVEESEETVEESVDRGDAVVGNSDASKTPEYDSFRDSLKDIETSVMRPGSAVSEDSNVNDETLAELKRLVEESIPTKERMEESIPTGDVGFADDLETDKPESGSSSEAERVELDDLDKTTERDENKSNDSDSTSEKTAMDSEMDTSERVGHVAKKQRINENAVLLAMEKPSPVIEREKEFDVPTEMGIVPFKRYDAPEKMVTSGRGRGSFSKPSCSSFSRPLAPHELLRMRGELPASAEKVFSMPFSVNNVDDIAPSVGRGRGIGKSQLCIPGQQRLQFSSLGSVSSTMSAVQLPNKMPSHCSNVPSRASPQPGLMSSALTAEAPKPEPGKFIQSTKSEKQAVVGPQISGNATKESFPGTTVGKPASKPVQSLPLQSKPVSKTSSSSFKLPPSPFDLVKNTATWGAGVPTPPEKQSPEAVAQNALLSALNIPMNKTSDSQFDNKNPQSISDPSNFASNSKIFSGNSIPVNFVSAPPSRPALGLSSAPIAQSTTLSTRLTGLTQNDMETGTNSGSGFSSESFNMLNKNPISALSEYAQSRKLQLNIKIVGESGPPHKKRFQMAAFVGNERFPAVCGTNKKDCKKDAADVALRALMANGKYHSAKDAPKVTVPSGPATHFDKIASLSHSAFNTLASRIAENLAGRKVLATLVMKRGPNDAGSVISMGTGNRCITGPQMSLEGHTVNDSHAEIITRRGFIRFLYKNLEIDQPGSSESLFEPSPSGKLKIKDGITFHLYISTAPCGDGALFSPRDSEDSKVKEGENKIEHTPTFTSAIQGIVRTKIEGGEGTIPLEAGFMGQTWDGILRGERLRTMSCSDKLCRWNIVGMQGALLTHFLDPIYLDTLTLGYLYDHGHLSRALCCRLERGDPPIEDLLPPYYKLNHPHIGRVTIYEAQRGTEKTKAVSLNWCAGDSKTELTDGTTGQVIDKTRDSFISRVAKKNLYDNFKKLCKKFDRTDLLETDNYYAAKQAATDFQRVKTMMIERLRKNKLGPWVQKPIEEKMFV